MTRVVVALALVALIGACSYVDREPRTYRPPGIAQAPAATDGADLFLRDCAWCHASDGTGTDNGPSIVAGSGGPADVDFVLSTGRMPLDDPDERMQRGPTLYSDEEIEAIVSYVEGLGAEGPGVPRLDLAAGNTGRGEVLYQENCAACHSSAGFGGALSGGEYAPGLHASDSIEVAEAIRVGPGTMPRFGDDTFNEQQLNDIVRYVDYLRSPADPGGFSLGRVGPVTEGLVGWLFGVGLLLLLIRWIGTRADE